MLEIKDLTVQLKGHNSPLLSSLSLTLNPGTITCIVGLSGCGKTTLISAINGVLIHEESGLVEGDILLNQQSIKDKDIMEISKQMGTVYQDPDTQIVFSSVMAELAFALENHCYPKDEMMKRINKIATSLEINHLLDRNPNELSGGEKQLVVLAAILVMGVDVLLLDEIMAQVDVKGSELIKSRLNQLRDENKTILMIEHDLTHLDLADYVYLLSDGRLSEYNGVLK